MHAIPVLYRHEMSTTRNESFSPSAGKPRAVVKDWLKHKLPIKLVYFSPASRETIALAHKRSYVDDVLDGRRLNGFGNAIPEVAATLPYTVGSMIAAAQLAIGMRARSEHYAVACSPSSGFHHAQEDMPAGFCTFNGLVITAMQLKRLGLATKVGIIDADCHYGDGTAALIRLHNLHWVKHWSGGETMYLREHAEHYTFAMTRAVKSMADCDVILYQAGADPHIDDPLGGMLTSEQMGARDRQLFRLCQVYGVPVAWNLAGGYQVDKAGTLEPVLALHRQTMRECIERHVA